MTSCAPASGVRYSSASATHSLTGARVLVTGAGGFVGRYLLDELVAQGAQPFAATLTPPPATAPAAVAWRAGDLRDETHVRDLVAWSQPDLVFHLAAISHVTTAGDDPVHAWEMNVLTSVRLLGALAEGYQAGALSPRVVVIGSAEQYGRHTSDTLPLTERHAMEPRTVYAATKLAQEISAMQCWRATGLPVIAARPFNHSGAGQDVRFLLPALTARVRALRDQPPGTPLLLGNTSPVRDFLHVRDVVAAYIALGRHGTPGTAYNVASGVGRSVREVAQAILRRVGVEAPLQEDPALVRPVDVPSLVGDASALQSATGWSSQYTFDDLLDDLLDVPIHAATY
jgi:GDP-4-dehydro-6-deoxy-D-mannose reductase